MNLLRPAATLLALAALVAGCWESKKDKTAFLDPGFGNRGVVAVAVLPAFAATSLAMAPETISANIAAQLLREKHYRVVAGPAVVETLRKGTGFSAYKAILDRVNGGNPDEPMPLDALGTIARSLKVEALLLPSVLVFQQRKEQVAIPTANGGTTTGIITVSVIHIRASLWEKGSRAVIWSNEHLERFVHAPDDNNDMRVATDVAVWNLMDSLPANDWAPYFSPSAGPTPVSTEMPLQDVKPSTAPSAAPASATP